MISEFSGDGGHGSRLPVVLLVPATTSHVQIAWNELDVRERVTSAHAHKSPPAMDAVGSARCTLDTPTLESSAERSSTSPEAAPVTRLLLMLPPCRRRGVEVQKCRSAEVLYLYLAPLPP